MPLATVKDMQPYLRLAMFDEADESIVSKSVSGFAGKTKSLQIGFSGFGIFPNENPVIYASVLASDSLLILHTSLYEHFGEATERA